MGVCSLKDEEDMAAEDKTIVEEKEEEEEKPEPWKSALFSMVFPGLGQIRNNDPRKGLLYFAIAFTLILTLHLGVTVIILALFWLYNIYDAYTVASRKAKEP